MFLRVSEADYPIQRIWILKTAFRNLTVFLFVLLGFLSGAFSEGGSGSFESPGLQIGFLFLFFLITVLSSVAYAALVRHFYRYNLEGQYLNLKQGIIRKQERHLPYGTIQNVIVKRSLVDRIFGLSVLSVENASGGGGMINVMSRGNENMEPIGFSGNNVTIPGLKMADAEALKSIILERMNANEAVETGSGL